MKRIVVLVLAVIVICTAGGYAAPLTDYSFGRAAFDLGVACSPTNYQGADSNWNVGYQTSAGWNVEFGATAGLGSNVAIQYKQQNMLSGKYYFWPNSKHQDFTMMISLRKV